MANPGTLTEVAAGELDDLFAQIAAEGITRLAFLGPGFRGMFGADSDKWPESLRGCHVYELREKDDSLAARIARLSQLTWLTLCRVDLDADGARAIAEHLGQLNRLWLHSNSLGHNAVAAIAAKLPRLTELNVARNKQFNDVAPLAELPGLRHLNIARTSVADLSPFAERVLAGMPVRWKWGGSEDGIFVQDCPLVHPTVEIALQGPEAVRNYFREIAAQGVDRLYEAKVLILGEGEAGKTSLLRRLYYPDQPLPAVDETTRGIDVHRQEFQAAEGRTFRLNVWDFGGQQIYHAPVLSDQKLAR